jgi:hypothetical protein
MMVMSSDGSRLRRLAATAQPPLPPPTISTCTVRATAALGVDAAALCLSWAMRGRSAARS